MLAKRIIPCLDIDKGRVVKGVNFVNLIDAGDPVETAKAYDKIGADEIVFLDITASSDGRNTAVDILSRASEQVFIPLTIGGGIRSVEDFRKLLTAGRIRSPSIPRRSKTPNSSPRRRSNSARSAWFWRWTPRRTGAARGTYT